MDNLEYQLGLPKKRMGAGALFFNKEGKILLVKPNYKNHWSFPGGVVDADESPKSACIREIKEEIGLNINKVEFVCVQYLAKIPKKLENLQFLFNAGVLSEQQIKKIKIDRKEIDEYKFVSAREALKLVSKSNAIRLDKSIKAIKNNKSIYIE